MTYLTRFSTATAVMLALGLSSCSHFSKQARQQRAYDHYVRKSSLANVRQSLKLRPGKVQLPPLPQASDPVASTALGSGPESVTSASE
ncbi:MAG TPA: hypothetical protein VGC85_09360 [Chthoniobacterales bacterium]